MQPLRNSINWNWFKGTLAVSIYCCLKCWNAADLLLKTSRQLEGSEMKKRSEPIWETYRLSVLQTAAKLEALNKNETFSESTIDHHVR